MLGELVIRDISLPIGPDLLTWPGDPPIEVAASSRIAKGDAANVSKIKFGSHTGTHVDPPFHFIDEGDRVDKLDLNVLVGEATVADLSASEGLISADDLESLDLPPDASRLLLKTRNSELWQSLPIEFPDSYVALSVEGARWIVDRGIRLVGTDFLSIETRGAAGHPVHVTLLGAGVVIVEGLNLHGVPPGNYRLVCLPLRIVDGDGAPARAVLIDR